MKFKKILFTVISIVTGFSLSAQTIESGKVYVIKNIGKPTQSLAASASVQGAVGANNNTADLRQQWYITSNEANTGYYIRNASTGAYLTSPKALYTQWPLTFQTIPTDDTMLFSITDYEGNKVIRALSHKDSYGFAHNDGSSNIVCWVASSTPTQWQFEEIPYTQNEINELLKKFAATGDEIAKCSEYETHLLNLFSDYACTELKVSGDLSGNPDFMGLPSTLQTMVDKVKSENWHEEAGDWDSEHAKKYRIQLYEPYSEGSAAASFAGIQAYTNMNNPTGIIANAGDMIYVMVDKDVKDGSTLYIGAVPDCNMYNSVTSGIKLKKGLNMILCNADNTHYFIYYTVATVQGKERLRRLSEYEPITIHIEGGEVNGFFNYVGDKLYKGDTQEDYLYTSKKAKHPMYDLIGKYVILHFFLEDTPDTPSSSVKQLGVKSVLDPALNPGPTKHYDPVEIIKAWDDMCFAERILMGIQSNEDIEKSYNQGMYSSIVNDHLQKGEYEINLQEPYNDYFNNRMMGITLQANGLYMNATSWRTAYAPSTISAILSQFPQDGIWGPAHEYGHMNQTPMKVAGTTEESNNVFSNVANYFVCGTTSRCAYPSEQLDIFNKGKTYLDHGTWGTTRMFWQLWCYYHATKHNTKFYPRLYELLRKYPLKRDMTTIPGKLNPKTDLLHFAKMCCLAAEEDLTNFFTSWGFFVPQENYHIDDYDVYDCILSQEDIDEVKKEIKSFGFEPNDAIILIDDRPGSDLPAGFGYNKDLCGQHGGLKDFSSSTPATGNFVYTVDGTTVTISGEGSPGVGYLIYDNDGHLIGFSNSDSFKLSAEAAKALVSGNATVKAIGADNVAIEVKDPLRSGDLQTKKDLLKKLIDKCDELLSLSDKTESHVGALFPASCESLSELRDEKYSLWETADESKTSELEDGYLELYDAYFSLLNDEKARIPIVAGAAYRMINYNYKNRSLDEGTDKCVSTTINSNSLMIPFSQQWILEPVVEGDLTSFYIKNLADGRYIGTTKRQSTTIPLSETPQPYSLVTISHGVYSFAPDNEVKFGIHIDAGNNVVQWNTSANATQWTLVKTSTPEIIKLRKDLTEKVNEAEQKLATSGTISRQEPKEISFPEDCMYTNAPYLGRNTSEVLKSWSILFDKDVTTYFHSNYDDKDSEDGLDHYIRMKAPDDGNFRFFDLSYTTRQNTNTGTNPRTIVIEASPDLDTWREIYHASNLPIGSAVDYSTGEIIAPEGTKYIRFMVTVATSLVKGHPYFCLSELSVSDLGEPIFTPDEGFPYLKPRSMQTLYNEIANARIDLADSNSSFEALTERMESLVAGLNALESFMIPAVNVSSVNIAVNPIVLQMGGEMVTVNADIDPENATFLEFTWNIEDTSIAEINSVDGKTVVLSPVSMGITNITVGVVGNPLVTSAATIKVLPEIPVESIMLVPGELSVPLNAGEFTVATEIYPADATVQTLTWSSSDDSIAEIDSETGVISMLRPGSCVISATSTDGTDITGKCQLTVANAEAKSLMIYPSDVTIQKGEEFTLNASYFPIESDQPLMEWSSSNPDVVSVDPSGIIRGVKVGTSTVSINSVVNGKELSASANVTVVPPVVKNVSLSNINLTIPKGEKVTLTAILTPEDAVATLIWNIDNSDVVNMEKNADGMSVDLTALKTGMTTVSVTTSENLDITSLCNIVVPEIPVEEIKFVNTEFVFDVADGKHLLVVKIMPEDAVVPRLLWEADDPSIVQLNPLDALLCELVPLKNGSTTIKVSHVDRPDIYATQRVDVIGTDGIARLFDDKETPVDVYDTTGKVVRLKTSVKELNKLQPGIYIIRQGKESKEVILK